jgi:small GTP-binding protein
MLNGKNYVLKLIDTAGQEDYERVRRLFYKDAKAFILCYSIENHASFNNIYNKWMPELKQIDNWPIPFILVGKKHLKKVKAFTSFILLFRYKN